MQDTTQLAPPRLHGAHLMAHQKHLQLQQEQQRLQQEQNQADSSAIVFGVKGAPGRGKAGAVLPSSPVAVAPAGVAPSPLTKPPRFSTTLVPDNKDVRSPSSILFFFSAHYKPFLNRLNALCIMQPLFYKVFRGF